MMAKSATNSRLASLLVQEGLVAPKRIVDAFEWQVVYGGTLDTALLEMNVLGEDALMEALCRATMLPTLHSLRVLDNLPLESVLKWFPQSLSDKYRAAPIAVDGNIVRVAVIDPPDRAELDSLGYTLGRSIDPVVVTEARFRQICAQIYGASLDDRFQKLTGKLRPVVQSMRITPEPAAPVVEISPASEVTPAIAVTTLVNVPSAASPAYEVTILAEPEEEFADLHSALVGALTGAAAKQPARQENAPSAPIKAVSAPIENPSQTEPLAIADATAAIEAAGSRNEILALLCRAARIHLKFAAMFMVQSGAASAKLALAKRWVPTHKLSAIAIAVALEKPSPFKTSVEGKAPYFGRIGEEGPSEGALKSLSRKTPLHGLLLPIILRDRVVALLYGDAGGATIEGSVLTELSTLVSTASRAFQTLIIRAKGGDPTQRRTLSGLGVVAQKVAEATSTDAALAGAAPLPIFDQPTGPIIDLEALVQSVIARDEHAADSAEQLLKMGAKCARTLVARLPGPVKLDRHRIGDVPFTEHGPLCELMARFGREALPPALEKLDDRSPDLRYYATLLVGQFVGREVIDALGKRLFDSDAGVRQAAAAAISRAEPGPELRTLLESLRGELPGPDQLRQRHATEALGVFKDLPSVPRMIALTKHHDPQLESASRQALVTILKQDFGDNPKRWRGWWDKNSKRPRIEFLLDGLDHAEVDVRESAFEELKALSGEDFGYDVDAPKREREDAQKQFAEWVETHGQDGPNRAKGRASKEGKAGKEGRKK